MKERPILFSGPMVRAILEGRKTQTRRLDGLHDVNLNPDGYRWTGERFDSIDGLVTMWPGECPKGKPGDRLWVRETWTGCWHEPPELEIHIVYAATGDERFLMAPEGYVLPKAAQRVEGWVTPFFMRRWASRITLEITDVRVQRVQAISAADCFAEGIVQTMPRIPMDPQIKFEALWDSINAKRGFGWDANPWVWAITFKRLSV